MKSPYKNTFLALVAAAIIVLLGSALHWSRAAADGKAKPAAKATAKKDTSTKKTGAKEETPQIDPMSVNATCYVCHMTFVHEEISNQHFEAKVTCVKCHGLSAKHANDENIGATKPDIIYARKDVDKMCEKCHEDHDVPPREVVARFIKRKLPAKKQPICTDCHGTHRIERVEKDEKPKELCPPGALSQRPAE
ncbi:MAG: multiheme c-type cytochrome [Planctomycetota bacterium]|nr:multiheme c-type cytochrome [Planctomycetota bacterium]